MHVIWGFVNLRRKLPKMSACKEIYCYHSGDFSFTCHSLSLRPEWQSMDNIWICVAAYTRAINWHNAHIMNGSSYCCPVVCGLLKAVGSILPVVVNMTFASAPNLCWHGLQMHSRYRIFSWFWKSSVVHYNKVWIKVAKFSARLIAFP